MKKLLPLVLMLLSLSAPSIALCGEPIYRYIDKNGTPCYADNLQVIPEQYRASAVIVGEESSSPTKTHQSTVANPERQPVSSSEEQRPSAQHLRFRVLISVGVVAGSVLLFIVLDKLVHLRNHKKVYGAVRIALIAMVSLYLLIAHYGDVSAFFRTANSAVDDLEQVQAEKGKKAAKALKTLNELLEAGQDGSAGKGQHDGTEQ